MGDLKERRVAVKVDGKGAREGQEIAIESSIKAISKEDA